MKKGIHPEYHRTKATCVTCGNTFETGSTLGEIRVDTCSKCHSYFTGKAGFTANDGSVDRFNKKYNLGKK